MCVAVVLLSLPCLGTNAIKKLLYCYWYVPSRAENKQILSLISGHLSNHGAARLRKQKSPSGFISSSQKWSHEKHFNRSHNFIFGFRWLYSNLLWALLLKCTHYIGALFLINIKRPNYVISTHVRQRINLRLLKQLVTSVAVVAVEVFIPSTQALVIAVQRRRLTLCKDH